MLIHASNSSTLFTAKYVYDQDFYDECKMSNIFRQSWINTENKILGRVIKYQQKTSKLKKHCPVTFHIVRKAMTAGTLHAYWEHPKSNMADLLTKPLNSNA